MVASDVVASVAAAAAAPISGKARLRLLAWLVADARGSRWWNGGAGLDKPAAETVGKRLERQADRVRAELDPARAAARVDRERVAAAGGDAGRLAVIDATEQAVIERARGEVYVGFHELESLMPEPYPVMPPPPPPELLEPEPEPAPALAHVPPAPAHAPEDVNDTIFKLHQALVAKGVRCPGLLMPDYLDDEVACHTTCSAHSVLSAESRCTVLAVH